MGSFARQQKLDARKPRAGGMPKTTLTREVRVLPNPNHASIPVGVTVLVSASPDVYGDVIACDQSGITVQIRK